MACPALGGCRPFLDRFPEPGFESAGRVRIHGEFDAFGRLWTREVDGVDHLSVLFEDIGYLGILRSKLIFELGQHLLHVDLAQPLVDLLLNHLRKHLVVDQAAFLMIFSSFFLGFIDADFVVRQLDVHVVRRLNVDDAFSALNGHVLFLVAYISVDGESESLDQVRGVDDFLEGLGRSRRRPEHPGRTRPRSPGRRS